jgi:hypothetical protein
MVQSFFAWFEYTFFSGIFYLTGINVATDEFATFILVWKLVAGLVVIILTVGIVYSVRRTHEVYRAYTNSIGPNDDKSNDAAMMASVTSGPSQKNIEAWALLRAKASSSDENERKIGIIAADSLIDKILDRAGYKGENLGSRLMQIEPSDLDSLQDVWEAHKVRNRIAHEAFYKVSSQEAEDAMNRFEKLLKELRYL